MVPGGAHTTIRKVAMGPRRSDRRNQFQRDRFFCSARPALTIASVNHPPLPVSHVFVSMGLRYSDAETEHYLFDKP